MTGKLAPAFAIGVLLVGCSHAPYTLTSQDAISLANKTCRDAFGKGGWKTELKDWQVRPFGGYWIVWTGVDKDDPIYFIKIRMDGTPPTPADCSSNTEDPPLPRY